MTKMTGAEILLEALRREKVRVLFGYPGGAVLFCVRPPPC